MSMGKLSGFKAVTYAVYKYVRCTVQQLFRRQQYMTILSINYLNNVPTV